MTKNDDLDELVQAARVAANYLDTANSIIADAGILDEDDGECEDAQNVVIRAALTPFASVQDEDERPSNEEDGS